MKSAKEIREDLHAEELAKQTYKLKHLLEWLQPVITHKIYQGLQSVSIYEWDHNIGQMFDDIKPILEEDGYVVERIETEAISISLFRGKLINTEKFVKISWE